MCRPREMWGSTLGRTLCLMAAIAVSGFIATTGIDSAPPRIHPAFLLPSEMVRSFASRCCMPNLALRGGTMGEEVVGGTMPKAKHIGHVLVHREADEEEGDGEGLGGEGDRLVGGGSEAALGKLQELTNRSSITDTVGGDEWIRLLEQCVQLVELGDVSAIRISRETLKAMAAASSSLFSSSSRFLHANKPSASSSTSASNKQYPSRTLLEKANSLCRRLCRVLRAEHALWREYVEVLGLMDALGLDDEGGPDKYDKLLDSISKRLAASASHLRGGGDGCRGEREFEGDRAEGDCGVRVEAGHEGRPQGGAERVEGGMEEGRLEEGTRRKKRKGAYRGPELPEHARLVRGSLSNGVRYAVLPLMPRGEAGGKGQFSAEMEVHAGALEEEEGLCGTARGVCRAVRAGAARAMRRLGAQGGEGGEVEAWAGLRSTRYAIKGRAKEAWGREKGGEGGKGGWAGRLLAGMVFNASGVLDGCFDEGAGEERDEGSAGEGRGLSEASQRGGDNCKVGSTSGAEEERGVRTRWDEVEEAYWAVEGSPWTQYVEARKEVHRGTLLPLCQPMCCAGAACGARRPNATHLARFHEVHYCASNVDLFVVGDVDAAWVRECIEDAFGEEPAAPRACVGERGNVTAWCVAGEVLWVIPPLDRGAMFKWSQRGVVVPHWDQDDVESRCNPRIGDARNISSDPDEEEGDDDEFDLAELGLVPPLSGGLPVQSRGAAGAGAGLRETSRSDEGGGEEEAEEGVGEEEAEEGVGDGGGHEGRILVLEGEGDVGASFVVKVPRVRTTCGGMDLVRRRVLGLIVSEALAAAGRGKFAWWSWESYDEDCSFSSLEVARPPACSSSDGGDAEEEGRAWLGEVLGEVMGLAARGLTAGELDGARRAVVARYGGGGGEEGVGARRAVVARYEGGGGGGVGGDEYKTGGEALYGGGGVTDGEALCVEALWGGVLGKEGTAGGFRSSRRPSAMGEALGELVRCSHSGESPMTLNQRREVVKSAAEEIEAREVDDAMRAGVEALLEWPGGGVCLFVGPRLGGASRGAVEKVVRHAREGMATRESLG